MKTIRVTENVGVANVDEAIAKVKELARFHGIATIVAVNATANTVDTHGGSSLIISWDVEVEGFPE